MHKRIALVAALLAVAGVSCNTSAQAQVESRLVNDAEQAVRTANADFYTALNAMFIGDAEPMQGVWSHADDVAYLPPTHERLTGWNEVQGCIQQVTDMHLGGQIEALDVTVTMLSPSLALVVTNEVGENPNTPSGPMQVNIRSSKLYRLEDRNWKLFYDHADLLAPLVAAGI